MVAAPSGTGKTTVCQRVVAVDGLIEFSVSHTTRRPRGGERDGADYTFVDDDEFERLVKSDVFLEHAEYQGCRYGTSRAAVLGPTAEGYDLILEVEVKGAEQLRERLASGASVVIHCLGGLGRTGMITARLLIEFGAEPDEAIAAVRAARPGAVQTFAQERYLRDLAGRHGRSSS